MGTVVIWFVESLKQYKLWIYDFGFVAWDHLFGTMIAEVEKISVSFEVMALVVINMICKELGALIVSYSREILEW